MQHITNWVESWTKGGTYAIFIFPILVILLLWASLKIVKYSEVIIAKTKLGGGFVGATLIATITSMPELITEITQASGGTPENGLGDDIGSNAFSIFLIGLAGIISYRKLFLNNLSKWTKASIAISFGMMSILSILIMINKDIAMGTIGIIPLMFFIFYIFTVFLTWKYDKDESDEEIDPSIQKIKLKNAVWFFIGFGVLVVIFSIFVNVDVAAFQDGLNIDSKSAGGVFLAVTTSLPEVVAFFAFLKKGFPGAAIGSLVGSHFFNVGILFFGDLAYTHGPTFEHHNMTEHYPLAIICASMLLLLTIHFCLSKKFKKAFSKKSVYMIIPTLITLGYIIGWVFILIYH